MLSQPKILLQNHVTRPTPLNALSASRVFRDRVEEELVGELAPSQPTAAPEPDPDNMTDAGWQLATHSYC